MNKLDLYKLIDKLPDSQIPAVGTFPGYVLEHHTETRDAHDRVGYDDEEYSEDELTSLEDAHQEYLRGEAFTQEEMESRYEVG